MFRKRWLFVAAVALAIVAAPIAWYLISPLFIDVTVDESFPVAQAAPIVATTAEPAKPAAEMEDEPAPVTVIPKAMPTAEPTLVAADDSMGDEAAAMPDATADAAMSEPTVAAAEPTPTPAEPIALVSGEFHDVAHHGTGTATIYRLPDGQHVLRFENLDVLNGPDLYVWLSAAEDAHDARTILDAEYVELGRLKGNIGDQNYEIPAEVDLSRIKSVTIWCRQFSVNFATAPLR